MTHSITDDHANSTQQRTVLLAVDNKNSVLAEVVAGQTNHIAYSVYGQQSSQQKVMTRLGFNGELREMQTSWYLLGNGYRAYNPRLMRFHSPDSWSPFGTGGLNAYVYCEGEPVMSSDPTGHVGVLSLLASFTGTMMSYTWRGANTLLNGLLSTSREVAGRGRVIPSSVFVRPYRGLPVTAVEITYGSVVPFSRPHGSPPHYFSHDPSTFTSKNLIPNTVGIFDGPPPAYARRAPRPSVRPPPAPPAYSPYDMSPLIDSSILRPVPTISTRTNPSHMIEQIQENSRHGAVANQNDAARIRRIERIERMRGNN